MGIATAVLGPLGVALDVLKEQIEGIVGHGEDTLGNREPLTPRSKKVLELARPRRGSSATTAWARSICCSV